MNIKSIVTAYCPQFLRPLFDRIENSPTGMRLASGMFWTMAGSIISRGLMFVSWILVARILGKIGYGELGMIQSTVGMFGIFAGFGLGLTATKHVAELRHKDPERAGRILGLSWIVAMVTGGLMALGLFIFAPWLAGHSINAPHLVGVLKIGALILFINALNGAQVGALSGFEAFKTIAYVNLFVGLISFPILITGAYFGGLTGAVWALAINLVFNWLINHMAIRKEAYKHKITLTLKKCSSELPILWRFSLPSVLSSAMVAPVTWACNAMLVNKPGGYGELGILTATLIFQHLLQFASGMMNAPLLSMVSHAGTNISERLGAINILSTWIFGVIFAIPLLCFPEIIKALFGASFDTRSFTLTFSIVMFYTTIIMYKAGLARVLAANNLLWWGFLSNALWAIFLMVSAVFLVKWGAPGLAASFAMAYILNTIIFVPLYYSRNLVPKGTIISFEAAIIWCVLLGLVLLNIADVPLLFRSIAFLPCMILTGIAFMRIYKGKPMA